MALVCEFTVSGDPKTKGSLRPIGRGKFVEQVDPLKIWRTRVGLAARKATAECEIWEPIDYPVAVDLLFKLEKPARSRFDIPATAGDIDKLQRNVFDALQDGKLLRNDARVVKVSAEKVYAVGGEPPGVTVSVWRFV